MEQQLRLADRRGVFQRPISAPADFGLSILMMLESNEAAEHEIHAVKSALAGADPSKLPDLFPQWFAPDFLEDGTEEAAEALASGMATEDYSAVKWESPTEESEVEEMIRLQQALASASSLSVPQSSGEWI